MLALRVIAFVAGLSLVASTMLSAIRIFIVPRNTSDKLARVVFLIMRRLFELRLRFARSYQERDRVLATYSPFALVALLLFWLAMMELGYAAMFWALGEALGDAVRISGSSLLTLGFAFSDHPVGAVLSFSEAAFGMILTALLISYLPTMYSAFSRREMAVSLLTVRAGPPQTTSEYVGGTPSAVNLLLRYHTLGQFDSLTQLWREWEVWFVDIEESHTSLAALAFFRSPQPNRSWVTAAGVVLDALALRLSTVDKPFDIYAALCIRAGFLSLRHIADFFQIPHNPNPRPGDPISVTRAEYEVAYAELQAADLPVKADRDQAWRDFAGWRVNYDVVLIALCRLTNAPETRWSSDRLG